MAQGPLELVLLTKVIDNKDFHSLEKLRISEEYFYLPEAREIYRFLREVYFHPSTAGHVPSREIIKDKFPGFYAYPSNDSVPILGTQLRHEKVRIEVQSLAQEVMGKADKNPMEAMSALRAEASRISSLAEVSEDLSMAGAYDMLLSNYETVQHSGGVIGIPFPWQPLNEESQGMQGGQFIVIYGRPKSMKCVCAGQLILMKDGSLVPIELVPELTQVPSYTQSTGKLRWADARRVVSGKKDCVEVTTKNGKIIKTSTEHLYMVPGYLYKRINELQAGDLVATVDTYKDVNILKSEVVWDEIYSIRPIGEVDCFDICIEDGKDPNFVVEGFIVHNTWVAIDMACDAYLNSRRRVLFYTREMPVRQIAQRIAACLARVSYGQFKNGKLQPELKEKLFTILKSLLEDEKIAGADGHQPMLKIISDRGSGPGAGGVGWLQSKIRENKPDLVIADGMYLMRDDRSSKRTADWQAVAHVSQDLKGTAQDFDIPVIGVTQANRAADKANGEDLTELAFSDAIGMDADLVLRVTKKERLDETSKKKITELYLTAPGMREGKFEGIVIRGEPATSFEYVRTIVNTEAVEESTPTNYNHKIPSSKPFKSAFLPPIKPPMKQMK